MSLDFAIREKHNYFRGQPKAYDWAINTLKMLQKDNKVAAIVFVGFEEAKNKLPNVKNVSDFTDTIKKPEQQRAFAVAIGDAIAGKKLNINRY